MVRTICRSLVRTDHSWPHRASAEWLGSFVVIDVFEPAVDQSTELRTPSVSQQAIIAVRSFETQLKEIELRLTTVELQLEDQGERVEGLEDEVAALNAVFDLAMRDSGPRES